MTTCLICQTLEQDPAEPQLHRLVRFYERKVGEQANRLLAGGDRQALERRITDLEQTVTRLNALLARRTT